MKLASAVMLNVVPLLHMQSIPPGAHVSSDDGALLVYAHPEAA